MVFLWCSMIICSCPAHSCFWASDAVMRSWGLQPRWAEPLNRWAELCPCVKQLRNWSRLVVICVYIYIRRHTYVYIYIHMFTCTSTYCTIMHIYIYIHILCMLIYRYIHEIFIWGKNKLLCSDTIMALFLPLSDPAEPWAQQSLQ